MRASEWVRVAVRGGALFLASFALLNVVGELVVPGFDENLWWIDLRGFPPWGAGALAVAFSLCLLRSALGVPRRVPGRIVAAGLFSLATLALLDSVRFFLLLMSGRIASSMPVPFSIFVAALALASGVDVLRPRQRVGAARVLFAAGLVALVFPAAHMASFGKTDYRRQGDVVVVFGSRVYADGAPSLSLHDRVATAVRLYHSRLVRRILVSGGPGDGATHETEAMRELAIAEGVDPDHILVDRSGLDTQRTVEAAVSIARREGFRRVLAVSHFYHLPRIEMSFRRAGIEVYTVPAEETRTLRRLPWFMAREVAAFWWYYARPLICLAGRARV